MVEEQIRFRFTTIQIISKRVAEVQQENLNKKFNYQITVEMRVQAPLKLVIPYVYIKLIIEGSTESVADFVIACGYEIEEFEKFIIPNEKGMFIVPEHFEEFIRPISISTVRGVIYSELRGTYLESAIMPVIFMDQFKAIPIEEFKKQSSPH